MIDLEPRLNELLEKRKLTTEEEAEVVKLTCDIEAGVKTLKFVFHELETDVKIPVKDERIMEVE